MPVYCFKCPACGHKDTAVLSVANRHFAPECQNCHGQRPVQYMDRDIRAEHGGFRQTPGNWPMLSDAMGVNVDQIPEALAANRRAGSTVTYDHEGRAILESPRQRRYHAKLMGLHDNNAGYSDPY